MPDSLEIEAEHQEQGRHRQHGSHRSDAEHDAWQALQLGEVALALTRNGALAKRACQCSSNIQCWVNWGQCLTGGAVLSERHRAASKREPTSQTTLQQKF